MNVGLPHGARVPGLRRLVRVPLAAVMLAGVLVAPAAAVDTSRGYDGPCGPQDSNGVTVVVDFQELDGNDGRPAPTIVRCSPVAGNDASVRRTGLQALVDAGIVVDGTARWGDDYPATVPFVCRVEGRPAAGEPLTLTASGTTYIEPCGDTPPGDAYWSYWHADGQGGDWTYSALGVMNRRVTPGGFEGWSFALNRRANDNPKPRVTPANPNTALTFAADRTEVEAGQSLTLSWKATAASHVVASGAWNGRRLAEGSETVTPTTAGAYVYTLTTAGLDPEATRSVTVTVTGDDSGSPPADSTPSGSTSSHARQSAGWLTGELAPAGQMPGPTGGTDWGLTIDTLWALHAAGIGAKASQQIVTAVARHAGTYMGPDLYGDKNARIGGSTAKLLVAAIVAGKDPEAFGTGRYLTTGTTYDLRAETQALIETSGKQKGRIVNRGTGNDETNVFAQSLAVIGLARSGGVPADAVDFLVSQQCSAGYFRMFYADKLSCDAAKGTGDGDGTAMGIQALMTARDEAGVEGLDDEIDRGLDWLLAAQRKDGSFGGGTGTEAANANSTGLIAQTLAAGAASASGRRATTLRTAHAKARDWVLTVHARRRTAAGSALATRREYGAIAYDKNAFAKAKTDGIGEEGRDQWRRATAQAIFALAPVSFADLGKQAPVGDPVEQNRPEVPADDDDGGGAAPPPGSGTGTPAPPATAEPTKATTPVGRLGDYLAAQLVDGDHLEVRIDDTTYVDYDATADLVFALTALGTQQAAAADVAAFLLHPKSVDAYARGAPYETASAAYAEPLAKLSLIARIARGSDRQSVPARTVRRLDHALAALDAGDGTFTDEGTYADKTASLVRQGWVALALTAAGDPAADDAAGVILDAQCEDGTFPALLSDAPSCAAGDAGATAVAVQAVNALTAPTISTRPGDDGPSTADEDALAGPANTAPASWDPARAERVQAAALAALAATGRDGRPIDDADDNGLAADLAVSRHAAGLDITHTSAGLARVQRPDGGFTATASPAKTAVSDVNVSIRLAPAVASHTWTGAQSSPVIAAVHLPLAADTAPAAATPDDTGTSGWLLALIGLLLLALGVGAGLAGPYVLRHLRKPRKVSEP